MLYSNNQQWQQITSGGYVKLKNRATGLYLDGLGQTTNGADAGQWSESTSYNQFWTIGNVAQARKSAVTDTLSLQQTHASPKRQVSLYPNPFKSTFNITIDKPEEVERIIICDLAGRQLETVKRTSVSGFMSMGASLKTGTYIIRVEAAKWLKTFKVVKVN